MPKFAKVNKDTCIGCGSCEEAAPDIFGLDEEGLAFVKADRNQGVTPIPEDQIDDLMDAFEECPTDSVMVSDHPFDSESE